MPDTPIYSLPFEVVGDQPGISLHGGLSGTEPILAEAVETELERIDTDVATANTAITAASDKAGYGWFPITAASFTTLNAFNIDLTNGGEFPAGTFEMVRVFMYGHLSTESFMQMRVNNDSTTDLHQRMSVVFSSVDGSVVDTHSADGTTWRLAQWGGSNGNTAEATIYHTDGNNLLSYHARGTRMQSGGFTTRRETLAHGRLASSRLITDLQCFPIAGSISEIRYWAEGFRMPA